MCNWPGPVLSELAAFRLLFHECYATVSQEMKVLVERSADSAEVRRLTNVERADRYDKQVKRLCGITIKDHVEPSDALVDLACTQYDNNRISYISWEKCLLTFLAGSSGLNANVGNDLKVQLSLQRRALAYDQANVIDYTLMMSWADRLMKVRMSDPPPGYTKVSFAQTERADRELNDQTRSGIQATVQGRPEKAMFDPE